LQRDNKGEKFINYSFYRIYRMTSTIQISNETKELISSFGAKGETYEDIIKRIYNLAVKEQLRQFLMPSDKYLSIEEARAEVEKKWPRSK
jgi:hypothetical protein